MRRIDLFRDLAPDQAERLGKLARPLIAVAGRASGGASGAMRFISSRPRGRGDLLGEPATLGRGDIFGEMALLTGEPRRDVTAVTYSQLLVLHAAGFPAVPRGQSGHSGRHPADPSTAADGRGRPARGADDVDTMIALPDVGNGLVTDRPAASESEACKQAARRTRRPPFERLRRPLRVTCCRRGGLAGADLRPAGTGLSGTAQRRPDPARRPGRGRRRALAVA